MTGTVHGVGVGPGDPELMTLKAFRLISGAEVVAYPILEASESFARSVAAKVMSPAVREIPITVPMTTRRAPAQAAFDRGSDAIATELEADRDVVVLCEGDPLFYGSFMYLHSRLSGRFRVEVVPGVNSVTACAAALGRPLVARNEALTIIPGTLPEADLEHRIAGAEAVAIMKVGRHLEKIRRVLARLGRAETAGYIERATLANQKVLPLGEAPGPAPYFSMILVGRKVDPWL